MSVSAQALDGVYGKPAAGMKARLEQAVDGRWSHIADAETDANGAIDNFVRGRLARGPYRIVFDTDHYFSGMGIGAAYPEITVVFRVRGEPHTCQVQVLMTPYSYSMYFGDRA
ncbi:5-hydroxyisourate hydrolase [Paractinoplanes abujensis]|jgi:5-hydroxyisourate hydrolase|uniref:5-hydroxyisourate hydrolase n=1 Tax=Paractinoplanes abujensis TaxID=882441 RepID=A0A7W7CQX8_9ACTN|nr:hydroxyisourate hydrolase [Actinoplanes abujensis]MBB4693028.1 5-hydroxyisourate hydrolase [Actinoplanes abujensis]GID24988.1 5-hydroxyisourate hydrolase [Actinoplanes abujensis]